MNISSDDLERVRAAMAAGHKIDAIKLYRQATGVGLAEAKEFVERLELNPQTGAVPAGKMSDATVDAIQEAIFSGQKIRAIKLYREASGAGLKEAKDFIEALEAELRRTDPTRFTAPAAKGCGTAVIALALIAVVALLLG
jgi:ribosomal protein L7/L12